jgi:Family of unknown function (DUF5681)
MLCAFKRRSSPRRWHVDLLHSSCQFQTHQMIDQPAWLRNHVPAPPTTWRPGQSGNPAGKKVGTLNKKTELAQAFHDEGAAIAQVVIDAAKAGDLRACELVLARLHPPLRARAQKVFFKLDPAASLTEQAQAVLLEVASGNVDPETGKMLIDCISSFGGLADVDELRRRLSDLEARTSNPENYPPGGVLRLDQSELDQLPSR